MQNWVKNRFSKLAQFMCLIISIFDWLIGLILYSFSAQNPENFLNDDYNYWCCPPNFLQKQRFRMNKGNRNVRLNSCTLFSINPINFLNDEYLFFILHFLQKPRFHMKKESRNGRLISCSLLSISPVIFLMKNINYLFLIFYKKKEFIWREIMGTMMSINEGSQYQLIINYLMD